MKIVELHEWIGSIGFDDPFIIELSYMIIWNRASLGITLVKRTYDGKGDQRYDLEYTDEVDRLIEVLSANWDHPCFA